LSAVSSASSLSSLRRDSFWFALFPRARQTWARFVDATAAVSRDGRRRSGSDDDDDDDDDVSESDDDSDQHEEDQQRRVEEVHSSTAELSPEFVADSERTFHAQIAEVL
jgi:hypothetical protein